MANRFASILLVVALLSVVAFAQRDHVDFAAASLSPTIVTTTDANPSLHSEAVATALNNSIPGGLCQVNVHDLNLISATSDQFYYMALQITVTDSATLQISVDDEFITEFDSGTASGSLGSCTGPGTCEFFYYCDSYVATSEVRVSASKANVDNAIDYDLRFTVFYESFSTIGQSRSFAQTTAVDDPYVATNPGPQNFIHFYHDLQPSVAELSASGRYFVEVGGFNAVTGTAYVCVSNTDFAAYEGSLTAISTGSSDESASLNSINTAVSDPCPLTCSSQPIGVDGTVRVAFDNCSTGCGLGNDLFIGVIPPSDSSEFVVNIRYRQISIPTIQPLALNTPVEGVLEDVSGFCDGTEGDFSCNDYYSVPSPTSITQSSVGPYLYVNVYGVYDGEVSAQLTEDALGGSESLCSNCAIQDSCDSVCDFCSADCKLMVYPCQWNSNLSNDWYVTVVGNSQDNGGEFIEYGLTVDIGEFPLDTVEPFVDSVLLGSVIPRHYHHYQITFLAEDIQDATQFAVELYSNSEQEDVRLFWRYGSPADDGTCMGYDGQCNTNDSPDGSFCRFQFLNCPIEKEYLVSARYTNQNPYYDDDEDDFDYYEDTVLDSGLRVAELQAGTYYFAVQGGEQQDAAQQPSTDYTISWKFTEAVQLDDQVTTAHHVYPREYSPQFFIDLPDDPTYANVDVYISDVTGGGVDMFLNCGALAGECPCWDFSRSCSPADSPYVNDGFKDCLLTVSACECQAGSRLYVSVLGGPDGSYLDDFYFSEDTSIGFTLTSIINRVSDDSLQTLSASRSITTVTGEIDYWTTQADVALYDNLGYTIDQSQYDFDQGRQYQFFMIDLSGTDVGPEDALMATLRVLTRKDTNPYAFSDRYASSDVISMSVGPTVDLRPRDITDCQSGFEMCRAISNVRISEFDFFDDAVTDSGSCTIVLEPCALDEGCYESNPNELRQEELAFTSNQQYFITLENEGIKDFATGYENDYGERMRFTLQVQVQDQSPVALTEGVAVAATVRGHSYQHFSFDMPASVPANSRLVVEFYSLHDQIESIEYFMNYFSGADGEVPVKAGLSDDCYANQFCEVCVTDDNDAFCTYEISPCELTGKTGTYFISARLDDGSYFDDFAEFTVKVSIIQTTELLPAGSDGLLVASSVNRFSTAFYSVTIPQLTGSNNVIGRILDIDIDAIAGNSLSTDGSVFVTITKQEPNDFCDCHDLGEQVADGEQIHWRRYSCELVGGETYFVSVTASDDLPGFDVTSFVIHAKLRDVIEIPVALSSSTDSRVLASASTAGSGTTIAYNDFIAYSFDVSPVAGSILSVRVNQGTQGNIPTPIAVWITKDSFFSPPGTNDASSAVGPQPDRDSCVSSMRTCSGFLDSVNDCLLTVDPCSLTAGTYYVTVSGEDMPLGVRSQPLSIEVVVTNPQSFNVPAAVGSSSDTTVSFTNDINGSFGTTVFVASAGLGGGNELEFSFSDVGQVDVSYGTPCNSVCQGQGAECDIIACNDLASDSWFVTIQPLDTSDTETLTVTRTAGPSGDLTITSPTITSSTGGSFGALGVDEWRYHSLSVAGDDRSGFTLETTASQVDIYYVDELVYRPNLVVNGNDEVVIRSDGTASTTCTAFSNGLLSGECCYPTLNQVFAVVSSPAYDLNIEVESYVRSESTLTAGVRSAVQTLNDSQIDWFHVTVPTSSNLYFDLSVTSGSADLYISAGNTAGSGPDVTRPFSSCWDNSGLISDILSGDCDASSDCSGFIASCAACLNLADNVGSIEMTFAVVPSGAGDVVYTLFMDTNADEVSFPADSTTTFTYPFNSEIVSGDSSDSASTYQFYSHQVSIDNEAIASFIPIFDDGDVVNRVDYVNVQFTFDNIRVNGVPVTSFFPLDIFISREPFAGDSQANGCYTGGDVTADGNSYPCLESSGGSASSSSTAVVCSISTCNLDCAGTVYFGVARSDADASDDVYTFDVTTRNSFDTQFPTGVDIAVIPLGQSTITSDVDGTYIKADVSSVRGLADAGAPQFVRVTLDNLTDSLGGVTTIDIAQTPVEFCVGLADLQTECTLSTSGGTTSCIFTSDPCYTQDALLGIDTFGLRATRTSSGSSSYSFDVTVEVLSVDPLDDPITVSVGNSYSVVKEIFNTEIQFFEFDVPPTSNYEWLSVEVSAVCCVAAGQDLEVYYSFDTSGTDVLRSKSWPSPLCPVDSANLRLNENTSQDIDDFCLFNGGKFRVTVVASEDLQLFADFPATYSVEVNLFEITPVELAIGCSDERLVTSDYNGYYEVNVEANNRGSELFFFLNLDFEVEEFSEVVLEVSNNGQPFSRTGNSCQGGSAIDDNLTDVTGDYFCVVEAGETGCVVRVPPCEFSNGIYYLFVEGDDQIVEGDTVFVGSFLDKKYIPTLDLVSTPSMTIEGVATTFYQYYRLDLNTADPEFLLNIELVDRTCDDDCDVEMYLMSGQAGFAADGNALFEERSPSCSACGDNCDCFEDFCSSFFGADCSVQTCDAPNSVAYLGVQALNGPFQCSYEILVTTKAPVVPLTEDVATCGQADVDVGNHFQVVGSTGAPLSFAEATMSITVTPNGNSPLIVLVGDGAVPGRDCMMHEFTCDPGFGSCTEFVQCFTDTAYISVYSGGFDDEDDCTGADYSILINRSAASIPTITLGQASGAISKFTSNTQNTGSFLYQTEPTPYSTNVFSDGNSDNDCISFCPSDTPVLVESTSASTEYFFSEASGMALQVVTPITINSETPLAVSIPARSEPDFMHFAIVLPDGVSEYTLSIIGADHCACDGAEVGDLGLTYRTSGVAPPFDGCNGSCTGDAFVTGGCSSDSVPELITCASEIDYVSIQWCSEFTCDVNFKVVVEFGEAAVQAVAGTHDVAFQTLETDNACGEITPIAEFSFFVDVTDILSVSFREPHQGPFSTSTVSVSSKCENGATCTVVEDPSGAESTCSTGDCRYSCTPPGRYEINVLTQASPFFQSTETFQLQVVNQWTDVSDFAANTITGDTRHFYRIANVGGSVNFDFSVTTGPALEFDIFTGCDAADFHSFNDYTVCARGVCAVSIPSRAMAPNTPFYYVVVTSGRIASGPNTNVDSVKDTDYSISVTFGTGNCAAPPTSGFCASTDFEGLNVFTDATSATVWDYTSVALQNEEAQCRFNDLVNTCISPSDECRRMLKILSCFESFPQCDGSGFQAGICSEVCKQVEAVCGAFLSFNSFFPEYTCRSDRYVENDAVASTCYNFPAPVVPSPPPTFPDTVSDESTPLVIDIPEFDPITVIIYLDDDGDIVGAGSDVIEVVDSSSGSAMLVAPVMTAILAVLLITL